MNARVGRDKWSWEYNILQFPCVLHKVPLESLIVSGLHGDHCIFLHKEFGLLMVLF